jgi:hypothetical protein
MLPAPVLSSLDTVFVILFVSFLNLKITRKYHANEIYITFNDVFMKNVCTGTESDTDVPRKKAQQGIGTVTAKTEKPALTCSCLQSNPNF